MIMFILTICNLIVFPSSSMVLIFCKERNLLMNHILYIYTHSTTYKIHANCADITLCICVIGKSEQQAGLSNAGVADQQQFEEIIAIK